MEKRSLDTRKMVLRVILAGMVLVMVLAFFRCVKDTVLACHDSLYEFILARIYGPKRGFTDAFQYGLARGRIGIVFPLVVAFRYLVNGTGNFVAIWLLQYVPILANIGLVSYIIGKKTSLEYGAFFSIFFLGLLQIDVWHSLIVCYPLDFMFGLFCMILAIYLFDGCNSKIRLVFSLWLFYESLQVYEAFIIALPIYVVIAFINNDKDIKKTIKKSIPHVIVAVVYVIMLFGFRKFYPSQIHVESMDGMELAGFAKAYKVYSFGMFPLAELKSAASREYFTPGKRKLLSSVAAIVGTCIAFYLGKKPDNKEILKLSLAGLIIGGTFAIPNSLIAKYQGWISSGVGGYVPTTICYFGWSILLVSVLIFAFSRKNKIPAYVFSIAIGAGVYLTCGINLYYSEVTSWAGRKVSNRAQTFYSMIADDDIENLDFTSLYAPGLTGVHDNLDTDEDIARLELGRNIEIYNKVGMLKENEEDLSKAMYYIVDREDPRFAFLSDVESFDGEVSEFVTSDDVFLISSFDGDVRVDIMYESGEIETRMINASSDKATVIDIDSPIKVSSLKASAAE